jgi:glycosyltransferase involved in cell wall biosynthesis
MQSSIPKKKKLLIVLNELGIGGAEVTMAELANNLISNFEVTILSLNTKNDLCNRLDEDINIVSLESKRIRNSIFSAFNFFMKNEYDVILLNLWPITSIFACILKVKNFFKHQVAKSKLIIIEHSVLSEQYNFPSKIKTYLMRYFIKHSYNLSDYVLCVSNGIKGELISYGVLNEKIKVIFNPLIDRKENPKFSKYQKDMLIEWKSENSFKLITVGNLKKQKNHIFMIELLKELPENFKLLIVGSGPLKNLLNLKIKEFGIENRVFLTGSIDNPAKLISEADLYISTSISESFGMSILEALSQGKTVVSNDCPYGPSEILGEEYPYLVKELEISSFKEVISIASKNLLNPKDLKQITRKFDLDNYLKLMNSLF